jgi:quercetin 2,3-dioxygenase
MKTIHTSRTVNAMIYAEEFPMGKIKVRQAFPSAQVEFLDPFILLHHAAIDVPAGINQLHEGVGPHPHRGFSPVTFIFKGGVHHRDSRGNNSVIEAGGVQWMNAGMGIIHSERPPANIQELGGKQEIIQMWVNTPAAFKKEQPAYFPRTKAEIPFVLKDEGKARINVVAGSFENAKSSIPTMSAINAYTLELAAGADFSIAIPGDHNAFIYLLEGEISISGYGKMEALHAATLNKDGEGIHITAKTKVNALLMSGTPLNEPIAAQGPFVMNTEIEIMEAMRDYRMGKMGILIED